MKVRTTEKISAPILVMLALTLFGTTIGRATPGDLDLTFSGDGKLTDPAGSANGVVVQPDGKIIVAGSANNSFLVTRYNSDGSPDGTFGAGGRVITSFGPDDSGAMAAAIQADGKIVVTGWKCQCYDWGTEAFVLIRYNPDGSLDSSFDGDGIVTTKVGLWPTAYSVVIQPDKKIIVGGFTWERFGDYADDHFALARYNPDGSLDTSFDGDGKVVTKPSECGLCNDDLQSIALQPDGKIVAVGGIFDGSPNTAFEVVRYNADGSLDTTFDFDGILIVPIGVGGFFSAVTTQADGKIVAAGASWNGTLPLVRLNSNGALDTAFDLDGKVTTPGYDGSYIAIQSNGKIVVAGDSYNGSNRDFKLIRYNLDGSLDTTFGGGDGETTVDFGGTNDMPAGLALDSAGRAVVVGNVYDGNSAKGISIARFLLGSTPVNADFDGDGRSDVSVFRPSDRAWYLNNSQTGFSAIQFGLSSDLITPGDFDGDGKTDIAVWRPSTGTWFIQRSTAGFTATQWGLSTDLPVPGDYDGDGKTDIAVFRPASGTWFIQPGGGGAVISTQFGAAGDRPVPGDYDGDGKTDLAVFRPSEGNWYFLKSTAGFSGIHFGNPTDKVVPGDYDGDGKTDPAVYRDGTWYLFQSTAGFIGIPFGIASDIPAPGDFDGDGKTDLSVFRPSSGAWFQQRSTSGFFATQFGQNGDKPVPAGYVPMQ